LIVTSTVDAPRHDDRGREATSPTEIPAKGWKDVLARVFKQIRADQVPLLSAGVAFYGMLALFPALIAVISVYGLVAEPSDVVRNLDSLTRALPRDARQLVNNQMETVVGRENSHLTVGLIVSVAAALWTASTGMQALVKAINVTFDEEETRKFLRLRGLALLLTLGGVVLVLVSLGGIVAVPAVLRRVGLGAVGRGLVNVGRWPLLGLVLICGLTVLYRYAPDRDNPRWRWATPGALVATVVWLVASAGFSLYVDNFGKYNQTYGTLGAVIVLLLWMYLSAFVVLLGSELDAELELQTRRDTTVGREQPMGTRQAYAADHLGETTD
jgi:membrane protein